METKNKILKSALSLFVSKGFRGTKTRDLIREAGIGNSAAVNYYFRSKENLYKAVIKLIFEQYYITNQIEKPDILFFIIGELQTNKKLFFEALSEDSDVDWNIKIASLIKSAINSKKLKK